LRQVFNYFDKDKSGRLNSLEVDNVLKRLNIQLSSDGYKQLKKELDKDGKLFIIQ
jgi:Ca2+-binding EF-hand superfamily protein